MDAAHPGAQAALTSPRPAQTGATVRYYVPLPRRLLADLRDTPLAIGVYALVARLYRLTREPVPLSPRDLGAFDPSLSQGAADRALRRLLGAGYLGASPSAGRKKAYRPTWGLVHGLPVPWDLPAACLGRPRHIPELRLPQELLDICLGRLQPNPHHAALVERYVGLPLLSLRDVGSYALASAGLPASSPDLEALGLLRAGQVLPVPPAATILAVSSQRAWGAANAPTALTSTGWGQTAFAEAPALPPADPVASVLFFVPTERVGPLIGQGVGPLIGCSPEADQPPCAAQCARPALIDTPEGSHGFDQGKIESTTGGGDNQPSHAPHNGAPRRGDSRAALAESEGGSHLAEGGLHLAEGGLHLAEGGSRAAPTDVAGESLTLLQQLHVNARVADELADAPAPLVRQAIDQARATPGVRDQARWVVGVLRDWKARGWPTVQPEPVKPVRVSDTPILLHPGVSPRVRQIWLNRFRAADPGERQAILDRFFQEAVHADAG
jgi:hypothetical protein